MPEVEESDFTLQTKGKQELKQQLLLKEASAYFILPSVYSCSFRDRNIIRDPVSTVKRMYFSSLKVVVVWLLSCLQLLQPHGL